ncbi:hypothetical protein AUC68_13890 [Methyloceanibacter methanicus]|uniref:Uncharacterized protein n=1 Tax=Methyloceanibacter methanicus TaxID=1774968 RepID=A0A1E3W599_9HYPH|nr:hypothetical protein [Methyloceanibacter methanicus]ODS00682.1 hypothetical protein AUC68_13890 [Methyloceanibacter methanicus]
MRILVLAMVLAAGGAAAQDFPTSALTPYETFRKALLRYGWHPMDDGSGRKGMPEVRCGAHMCIAAWRADNGAVMGLSLWEDDAGTLRVAPQADDFIEHD